MFSKIFDQIYDSSIAENYQTRHIFMDLLVLADQDGVVDMTVEAVARRTNIPIDLIVSALSDLSAPDKHSRSKKENGRRLVPIEDGRKWGWRIVNYKAYHQIRNEQERREKNREYQRKSREKKRGKQYPVSTSQHQSAPRQQCQPIETETEKETEKKKISPQKKTAASKPRKPNPLWDITAKVFGLSADTKNEKSRLGKIARDLKLKGATPADVRRRAKNYKLHWPNMAFSPESLLKHWNEMAEPPEKPIELGFELPQAPITRDMLIDLLFWTPEQADAEMERLAKIKEEEQAND